MNKRLLIITEAYDKFQTNGVVTTLNNTKICLEKFGYEVIFITPELFKTIDCPTYPEIQLTLNPWKVGEIIEKYDPDYIHIATEGPLAFFGMLYCEKNNISFSSSYHTKLPEYINKRFPWFKEKWVFNYLKRLHKSSSSVLVTTRSMYNELTNVGFKNLKIWGRGIDRSLFNSSHKKDPQWTTFSVPKLLYVGRISIEKNLEDFLKVDPPILYTKTVVGDGPLLDQYKKKYPNVEFLGKLTGDSLAEQYANADVFVFPSKTDTFGLVMLEAMACGTPIAAYPVTGPKDIIINGRTGYLDNDLSFAIMKCLELSRITVEEFSKKHSWDDVTKTFDNSLMRIEHE